MADYGIFLAKMNEIVNNFFLNLYIIKILGRPTSVKIMYENSIVSCVKFLKQSFI